MIVIFIKNITKSTVMVNRRVNTAQLTNKSSSNLETVERILSETTKQQNMLQKAYDGNIDAMQEIMKLRGERFKLYVALAFAIYIIIGLVVILIDKRKK